MKKQILLTIAIAISLAISTFAQQPEVKVIQQPGQPPVRVTIKQGDAQPKAGEVQEFKRQKKQSLYVQFQRIAADGSYSPELPEVRDNVAKFIRQNSLFEPDSQGDLKECLEFSGTSITRVACSPNRSIFYADVATYIKPKVKIDEKAVANNQKWSGIRTIAQILGQVGAQEAYWRGRYRLGQIIELGGYFGGMIANNKMKPTESIEIVVKVSLDNFGYFNTTGVKMCRGLRDHTDQRLCRKDDDFRLSERYREYVVKLFGDGRTQFVSYIFKGEPTETPDGEPAWRFDDVSIPFRGQDLGDDWEIKLRSVFYMQLAYEVMKPQFKDERQEAQPAGANQR